MVRRLIAGAADAVLGPVIPLSFSRPGYRLRRAADGRATERDMTGKVCVVTGANSGIGLATSRALSLRGATVYALCRNRHRGQAAVDSLRAVGGDAHLEVVDVADPRSIRACAARFDARRVDVLVHNAGVLPATRQTSPAGVELTFATHVLGPFLLTELLLSRLAAADDARVITVSSGGMYLSRLQLEDPNWSERPYDGVTAYAETKRAQVVLTEGWAERYGNLGPSFHCMHPGWADTPAVRRSLPRFYRLTRRLLRTPEQGADTVVWLSAADRVPGPSGSFWFDRKRRSATWLPQTRVQRRQRDQLWSLCRMWLSLIPDLRSMVAS